MMIWYIYRTSVFLDRYWKEQEKEREREKGDKGQGTTASVDDISFKKK